VSYSPLPLPFVSLTPMTILHSLYKLCCGWVRRCLSSCACYGNLFDGMLAVEFGQKSALGPIFNDLPDRPADVFDFSERGLLAFKLGVDANARLDRSSSRSDYGLRARFRRSDWRAGTLSRPAGKAASLMSLLITMMGFVGGLTMSAIKRDRGVKDFGGSFGGHGGFLDRIDSICFAAPVFFHITKFYFAA
jgi:phosphatidate cytidylyltransferase